MSTSTSADDAIVVSGLVKRFGSVTAVDGLNLVVRRGECMGLLGPNGAGKTTTIEILEGLQRADAGSVRVLGGTWETDAESLRQRIGVQLQESQLYEKLSVRETIDLFRSFYARPFTAQQALEAVGLVEKSSAWVGTLSGGQRQRLSVATALVADPELYFFDEPTTGLDPTSRRELWEVLRAIRSRGRTTILTTHYLDEAERLCDRVAIVNRGRVIALGTPAELVASLGGEQVIEITTEPALSPADVSDVTDVASAVMHGAALHLQVRALPTAVKALLERCAQRNARVVTLVTRQASLEDVFVKLTGRTLEEADPVKAGAA